MLAGRFASSGLHGVPKDFRVPAWFWTELPIAPRPMLNLRNLMAAPAGYVLASLDYRQIEFRVLAHLSGDQDLLRVFNNSDRDIFTEVATQLKRTEATDHVAISHADRQAAKAICYGIIYGQTQYGLAGETGMTEADATRYSQLRLIFGGGGGPLLTRWSKLCPHASCDMCPC